MHPLVELLVGFAAIWGAAGFAFAVAFVTRGVSRIDPMAVGAPWTFRLLILPGTVIVWPLLAIRWWLGSASPPVETNAHRRAARPNGTASGRVGVPR